MIDIKILRTTPDVVEKALTNKGVKGVNLQEILTLDASRIKLQQELDVLRARRNEISASMGAGKPEPTVLEEAKSIKEKIATLEKQYEEVETNFLTLFKKVPNIPTEDTPIGLSEEENKVVKQWGKIPEFAFEPKNHYDIAQTKDWIDKERAANVSGARFAYLKGDLVKLQLALMTWVIDTLSNESVLKGIIEAEKLNISSKPFTPIFPPYMIKTAPYDAMDRLEPREERYKIE